jgi:hypothetical protein
MLRNIDGGPLGGARAVDPREPGGPPGRCQSYKSGSVHHQHQETSTVGPLRVARAGNLGAPTINTKKCRQWAPWEVPEL